MPTANPASALKLDYVFASTPTPIRASAEGAPPNTIDLQVIVSNPLPSSLSLSQVTIDIPTGEETSRAISLSRDLPAPLYDTTGPWSISSAGGTITIKPRSGTVGSVTSPILFSLNHIQVNETPGTVGITITEFPPLQPSKLVDTTTYRLVKETADYPVINFYADPATVTDLKQVVTLHWTCSEQGKSHVFGLRIAGMPSNDQNDVTFKNCVADGNCYTWQDGVTGVVTPPVNVTTTFALDVVTVQGGHREVVTSLTTTVQATMPWISPNSYVQPLFGGRVLWLHWLAFNARSCTVELDGETVDDNAPTDTYTDGYLVIPPDGPGPHSLSVTAHAATGRAQASFPFPDQWISPATKINVPRPWPIVITPDGKTALVGSSAGVTVIDVAARKAEPATISPSGSLALTPDGLLALVLDSDGNVGVIDVPGRKAEPAVIPAVRFPASIAITPDGSLALVGGIWMPGIEDTLVVIDIASRKVQTKINLAKSISSIAFTPDGALALLMYRDDDVVAVMDMATRTVEARTIPMGLPAGRVAITPDGALALVSFGNNTLGVIDIATRTLEDTTIPTRQQPYQVAITPDSTLALVPTFEGGLTIVNIARRSSVTIGWAAHGTYLTPSVAITPDGAGALIGSANADQTTYVGVIASKRSDPE